MRELNTSLHITKKKKGNDIDFERMGGGGGKGKAVPN